MGSDGGRHGVHCGGERPELLKLRVTKYLFADEMQRLAAADIGSAFYCAHDHGARGGLDPAIRFARTKTLMSGNDCSTKPTN